MRRIDYTDLATIDIANETPAFGERILRDSEEPRLGLRLRASALPTWVAYSRKGARVARNSLGPTDPLSLEAARSIAGTDTVPPDESPVSAYDLSPGFSPYATISEVLPRYLAFGDQGRWKASTGKLMRGIARDHILPILGARQVRDVTAQEVAGWHKDVTARTSGARMALSTVSGLMRYAEDHGLRPAGSNPCRGLRKKDRSKRGRHLPPATVRHLWRALNRLQSRIPATCDAVRLLLLTGARKSEIFGLTWDRIAGCRAVLEDSKTGPRTIWLSGPARAILEERRPRANGPFVFPNTRGDGPAQAINRHWKMILEEAGIPALRVHDLRHHFAAVGVSNGIDLKVVGQLLGHKDIDSTLGYAHLATAALVKSASSVSAYIDRSLSSAAPGEDTAEGMSSPLKRDVTDQGTAKERDRLHD